jgi:hypothetical protein
MPEEAKYRIAEPFSRLAAHIIERNYRDLGCDDWDTRKIQLLCAKLGDTDYIMAARLRIPATYFREKMRTDRWSRQEGIILTLLEREIDLLRGDVVPARPLFVPAHPIPEPLPS